MIKSLATKNVATVALGLGLVLALTFSFATPAKAVTIEELQAQIQTLLAQIAALQGGTGSQQVGGLNCSTTFTQNLTVGSTGGEVMAVQKFLNSVDGAQVATTGAGSPGNESSYFGALTRAAVSQFQAKYGITPTAGYWGPISRSQANSLCAAAPTTPTTPGTPTAPGAPLQGGAGSITDVDFIGSLNNEDVGEGANDVEVAGLDIEADEGSDIELTAVTINFDYADTGADTDLDDYADEVSVWFDGKEVARLDASDFDDDNNYSRTVSLGSGSIIRADERGDLVVAVSGVSNLDSTNAGENWNVGFEAVRFRDAQGATVTDTSTGDIQDTGNNDTTTDAEERQFTFQTFATAEDVTLKAVLHNDSPDSYIVDVDDTSDTDGVELLRFTLEAENGEIRVRDIPITLTVTGTDDIDDIASVLYLEIDGVEYSENISTSAAAASVTFDDLDYTIDGDDVVTVIVRADVNDTEGTGSTAFDDGDTLKAEFTASNRNVTDAEDETGENLAAGDKTGTALGDALALYDSGINVTFVSASESVAVDDGADDDTGTFKVVFNVEAFDGSAYLATSTTATTTTTITSTSEATNGHLYVVEDSGTATTDDLADLVSFTTGSGASKTSSVGNIELSDGESTQITITVTQTNDSAEDDGLYRMLLQAIAWAASDTTTYNLYTFDLEDYKTDPISLN